MPYKPKEKMKIEERAKQFAPFAALSTLDGSIKKKAHSQHEEMTANENEIEAEFLNYLSFITESESRLDEQ